MDPTTPAAKEVAARLAASADLPTEPWAPQGFSLPRAVTFLGDRDRLVAAVTPGADMSAGDQALVYGIAHAGNRALALLLPDEMALTARLRASGLRDVHVYSVDQHGDGFKVSPPQPVVSDAERQILSATAQVGSRPLKLSDVQEGWLWRLDELTVYPYLVPEHRRQYRAWHCMGRQLIKVTKGSGNDLQIEAGVAYTHPTAEQPEPHRVTISGEITVDQFEEVKKAVYRGMIDRFAGGDQEKHLEHRLQSVMKGHPQCFIPQPLSNVEREFPARRPNGRQAFIDFLYVGQDHQLHVVETKIGLDEKLIVQGLDYWLWANANLHRLVRHFDRGAISGVVIDYVVATKKEKQDDHPDAKLLSSYAPAQLRRLRDDVTHNVYRCQGWWSDDPSLHRLRQGEIETKHVKQTTMNGPHW